MLFTCYVGLMVKDRNLVWMDLEMTGLDPERHVIIEIASIVTDSDLNVVAEGPELVIKADDRDLSAMNRWNIDHHTKSGLLDRVQASEVSLAEAEAMTLEFLKDHTLKRRTHLCGNSVWQDRRFLRRHMPLVENWFHYRIIDVSSIKELVKRWHPKMVKELKKNTEHRALADVRESIDELKFYRDRFFMIGG